MNMATAVTRKRLRRIERQSWFHSQGKKRTMSNRCDKCGEELGILNDDMQGHIEYEAHQHCMPDAIAKLAALFEAATKGEWTAYRMIHADTGEPLTPDEIAEYVRNSVIKSEGESGTTNFLFITCEKDDGSADVCHVGNGPMSPQNAAAIAHAHNLMPRILDVMRAGKNVRNARVAVDESKGNSLKLGISMDWMFRAADALGRALDALQEGGDTDG